MRKIKFRAWDNGKIYKHAMVGYPANPAVFTDIN